MIAGSAAAPALAAPAAGPTPDTANTVTLITGDQVTLAPDGRVARVQPGEGRKSARFSVYRGTGRHTVVLPHDAIALLRADKLDQRLFDVTQLLEFGYRDRLPLIIGGHGVLAARTAQSWAALRTTTDKIWLNGLRKPTLDHSVPQIGAPAAWQAGFTGKGVKVAVLDTGVDENHPDLKGRQLAERNFTEDPDNTDNEGHGTHVASTIASTDAKYRGVAPDAQILDGKVCMETGCEESWILEGMRWAVENGADVVNMSLGGTDGPEIDPLEEAVNRLSAQYGTLFVIAAGNSGRPETIGSPGSADAALTVGAVDRDDKIAWFSSRGPRTGDGGMKPEITAPGVGIVAAEAGTTGHVAYSGTSMATPHVAGAVALLKQQHPEWKGAQLKAALAGTAKPAPNQTIFDQGLGRVDLTKAIKAQVFADQITINFGTQQWPHGDDKPVTKDITYVNPTDQAVTADVRIDSDAPAGLFSLSATKITVPAKGKASVTVTGDTRVGTKDAAFSGQVTATADGQSVRTLVSIDREVESYDVTLSYIERNGGGPGTYVTSVEGLDTGKYLLLFGPDGPGKVRVPKGTYVTETEFSDEVAQSADLIVQPKLVVNGDTSVTFDARTAKPVSMTAPEPTTDTVGEATFRRVLGNYEVERTSLSSPAFGDFRTAQIGGPLPADQLSTLFITHSVAAADDTTFYRLALTVDGRVPTGFAGAPRKQDLARVEHKFGPFAKDAWAMVGEYPTTDRGLRTGTVIYPVPPDRTAVEFVTTRNVRWESYLTVQPPPNGFTTVMISNLRRYQPDRSYTEREFFGVFGPSLSKIVPDATRTGGHMSFMTSMTADSNGGWGGGPVDSIRTTLHRDGVLVGESPARIADFDDLPAAPADYRAEVTVDRSGYADLSTKVSAAWTFRSGAGAGDVRAALPISVVRFTPKLDDNDSLPGGRTHRIALSVQQQEGAGRIRHVDVDYSLDEGKTWRRALVIGDNAFIDHPAGAGTMSLRAKAADSRGNTVEQSVIRAYKVT
ncbi:S8 family serine peptidase [Lentzea sp. NPDC006480]|uniref:S8 family serine peptidase n=1 Tax=Lentzea sp. NPDC006480 TaxID=3157176 RepID=UPI0033A6ECC5